MDSHISFGCFIFFLACVQHFSQLYCFFVVVSFSLKFSSVEYLFFKDTFRIVVVLQAGLTKKKQI